MAALPVVNVGLLLFLPPAPPLPPLPPCGLILPGIIVFVRIDAKPDVGCVSFENLRLQIVNRGRASQ